MSQGHKVVTNTSEDTILRRECLKNGFENEKDFEMQVLNGGSGSITYSLSRDQLKTKVLKYTNVSRIAKGRHLFSNFWFMAISLVFSSGLTVFQGVGFFLVQTTTRTLGIKQHSCTKLITWTHRWDLGKDEVSTSLPQ